MQRSIDPAFSDKEIGMSKKMLFVYNPKAGKERIKSNLADILDVFASKDYEITIAPTRKQGDAVEIVAGRDPGYELVVCSGGDGTLDETVTGILRSGIRTPIGYIPAGSTNDFGGSLSLPKNMVQAAETIMQEQNFSCDIGKFNDAIFVYIAAFGIFTDVSYETDQEMKNTLGHMAYVLEGMKRLPSVKSQKMKIFLEDRVIEDEFLFGMVTNSMSVGGFKNITGKDVLLDDGLLEVTLIKRPRNPVDLNGIMMALLNRDMDSEYMYYFRTSHLTVESEEPVAWTLDGENGGSHTKVEITDLCRAVDIRVNYTQVGLLG